MSKHPFWTDDLPRYARLGWSGTRLNLPPIRHAMDALFARVQPTVEHLTCSAPADQAGVDFYARRLVTHSHRPHQDFPSPDRRVYQLIRRSGAMVEALNRDTTPCLLAGFPGTVCPMRVSPSAVVRECFNGGGSGTWATLAYAAGRGIDLLVWLDGGTALDLRDPPPWWWGGWSALGDGWWYWDARMRAEEGAPQQTASEPPR